MSHSTDRRPIAEALEAMAAELFHLPRDGRTRQGAAEMADLLLTVARLRVDPAERPSMPRPGDPNDVDQN